MKLRKQTTTVGETVSISYAHGEADFSDLVHVVRCKDCKHYKKDHPFYYYREDNTFHLCSEIGRYTDEGDYCSYGERKDG